MPVTGHWPPNGKSSCDFRWQSYEALNNEATFEFNFCKGAKYIVPVNGSGSGNTAITFRKMHVGTMITCCTETRTNAFFLNIHVIGVEVDGHIGLVKKIKKFQRLATRVEEVSLVTVARFDGVSN